MSSINDFLMDNISNRTSLRNVANSLNNINLETNHKTVGNYLELLSEFINDDSHLSKNSI